MAARCGGHARVASRDPSRTPVPDESRCLVAPGPGAPARTDAAGAGRRRGRRRHPGDRGGASGPRDVQHPDAVDRDRRGGTGRAGRQRGQGRPAVDPTLPAGVPALRAPPAADQPRTGPARGARPCRPALGRRRPSGAQGPSRRDGRVRPVGPDRSGGSPARDHRCGEAACSVGQRRGGPGRHGVADDRRPTGQDRGTGGGTRGRTAGPDQPGVRRGLPW
jgi:hypothetical protein